MKNGIIIARLLLVSGLVISTFNSASAKSRDKPEQTDYRISRYVFGSGGIIGSTGAGYLLFATAGETVVDLSQDASNVLLSGYWHKNILVIPNGDQDEVSIMPKAVELLQNYPNPFSSQTTIEYGLPYTGKVTVEVFNLLGERVQMLINSQIQGPGYMKIIWNGSDDQGVPVDPGLFIYRISVIKVTPGNQQDGILYQLTRKMVVVK
jgi:hypothetical protein